MPKSRPGHFQFLPLLTVADSGKNWKRLGLGQNFTYRKNFSIPLKLRLLITRILAQYQRENSCSLTQFAFILIC